MRFARWLAALTLAVAGLSFTAGPATAAGGYCTSTGVNVVVDFGALGRGVDKACGRGSVAVDAFTSAGFSLTSDPRMSNYYVCTVDGQPSNRRCHGTGTEGYWALFVAQPGASWIYANCGADCQEVSNGQTVAFAWQSPGDMESGGHRNPATSPASARVAPTPRATHQPSSVATTAAAPGIGGSSTSPTASGTPTKATTGTPTTKPTTKPTSSASADASTSPTPTAHANAQTQTPLEPANDGTGGLPWWIPVGIGAVLVIGAVATWIRKRTS